MLTLNMKYNCGPQIFEYSKGVIQNWKNLYRNFINLTHLSFILIFRLDIILHHFISKPLSTTPSWLDSSLVEESSRHERLHRPEFLHLPKCEKKGISWSSVQIKTSTYSHFKIEYKQYLVTRNLKKYISIFDIISIINWKLEGFTRIYQKTVHQWTEMTDVFIGTFSISLPDVVSFNIRLGCMATFKLNLR